MESMHRQKPVQPGFLIDRKNSAGANSAATSPHSATSAEHCPACFQAMHKADPHSLQRSLYLALGAPGFLGIKIVPGGAILFTAEKFRSFKASEILPRE